MNLVAMLRLMNPNAMIPATTAVGTIDPRGREKGNPFRGKCRDAESFTGICAEKLYAL